MAKPTYRSSISALLIALAFSALAAGCTTAPAVRKEPAARIRAVRAVARIGDGTLPDPTARLTWQRTLVQPLPNAPLIEAARSAQR